MQRAIGIFVAGLLLGGLAVFGFTRTARKETSATVSSQAAAGNNSGATEASLHPSGGERDKLILGNIATVPFQELYSVLAPRSSQEMAEIAAQFNDLPPGRETRNKITAFFTAWAHLDANAALSAAASLNNPEARSQGISAVIRGADAAAARSLVTMLSKLSPDALPPAQKSRSLSAGLSKWSEIDPVQAAKFLDESGSRDGAFYNARMSIAQNWAASDPSAALAWAQAQTDRRDRGISVSGVISGWWENDPRAAEDYVTSHLDDVGLGAVMRITSQLFEQDPQRAREWASRLPTAEARRNANTFIVSQMADNDPKAASEWAANLPEDVRSRTLGGAIAKWARNDPQAAGQWINGLNGAVRDEAIATYSTMIAPNDAAAALGWAVTVADQKIRTESVERILNGWLRRSPSEARTWIQNSVLPEPEKARLLALPTGR